MPKPDRDLSAFSPKVQVAPPPAAPTVTPSSPVAAESVVVSKARPSRRTGPQHLEPTVRRGGVWRHQRRRRSPAAGCRPSTCLRRSSRSCSTPPERPSGSPESSPRRPRAALRRAGTEPSSCPSARPARTRRFPPPPHRAAHREGGGSCPVPSMMAGIASAPRRQVRGFWHRARRGTRFARSPDPPRPTGVTTAAASPGPGTHLSGSRKHGRNRSATCAQLFGCG